MSMFSSLKGLLLGSLVLLPSVAQAQAAADPNCWRPDEVEAARFEDFRLMLMVGALNCKNFMPGVAQSYNAFMTAKKELILSNLYVVRAHFVREAGVSGGATEFANYETLHGNRYSSPSYGRAKCEAIDAQIRVATAASDADLFKLVAVMSPGPLPSGCKAAPRVIAALAPTLKPRPAAVAPVITPDMTDAERVAASTAATRRLLASRASAATFAEAAAPTPVVTAAVAVAPTPEPTAVAEAAPIPAALLIAEPKPVEAPKPAAVAVEAAPVAAPSAAQALAEAAKALAAAAAAMQTAAPK